MKITTHDQTGTKYLLSWDEKTLAIMWTHSKDKAYIFGAPGKVSEDDGKKIAEWIGETAKVTVNATD